MDVCLKEAGSYPTPGAKSILPGRLSHARDFAGKGKLAEGYTGNAELADEGSWATAEGAAVTDADLRGVAGEFLELLLCGEEFFVVDGWVSKDGLKLGALSGELGGERLALFVAIDGGCLRHCRKS